MLGTRKNASNIFNHHEAAGWHAKAPAGWKTLGSGAYRTAYLNKQDGLVYKVGDSIENALESINSRRLRRKSIRGLGVPLYVPRTFVHRFDEETSVLVQEFAKGSPSYCDCEPYWNDMMPCTCRMRLCHGVARDWIANWSGMDDVHGGNILYSRVDKRYTFVDLSS